MTKSRENFNITQSDILGRNLYVQTADHKVKYTYDMAGNAIEEASYSNNSIYNCKKYTYDSKGNVLSCTESSNPNYSGTTTSFTYTDGNGNKTLYTYDILDHLSEKSIPFSVDSNGNMSYNKIDYTYDAMNNLCYETNGYTTSEYVYDHRNRLTEAYTGSQKTGYRYDKAGNMVQMEKAYSQNTYNYEYDNLNRLTKYTDAMGYTETYEYDEYNDMIKKTDRNGNTITYTYDGLHRKLSEKASDVNNTWGYGLTGGVLRESNANEKISYTYNDMGLPKNKAVTIGSDVFKTEYIYDYAGRNTADEYYKNNSMYNAVDYTYDFRNRLSSVTVRNNSGNPYLSKNVIYTYDKNDNITNEIFGDNSRYEHTYNAANLVTDSKLINTAYNNSVEMHAEYEYRPDGNLIKKREEKDVPITVNYEYDSMNRLISETANGGGDTDYHYRYTYDNAGNRIASEFSDRYSETQYKETYSYDKNNRLTRIERGTGITEFTYDKNGNQTKIEKYNRNDNGIFALDIKDLQLIFNNKGNVYGNTELFKYNGLNQLVHYENTANENGKSKTAEYKYGPDGYRVSKEVNNTVTGFIWNGDNIAAELNENNVVTVSYLWGNKLISDSKNKWYKPDAHGHIGYITYSAFGRADYFDGEPYLQVNGVWNYRGQYFDEESGMYYMRARYYNTDTGRFITEDPIKDGYNWYAYCGNNPLMFADPSGLFDYDSRLSQSNQYNKDVEVLQNELVYKGYMKAPSKNEWGYFGPKTTAAVNAYKVDNNINNSGVNNGVVDLQTWKSLGLIYRTPEDKDAGVEIVTRGRKQFFDVSIPYNELVYNALIEASKHVLDVDWFISKVNHGKPWDIKIEKVWTETLKISYPGSPTSNVIVFGEFFTPEQLGNILYGYAGSAALFPKEILLAGSIKASGIFSFIFDENARNNEFSDHPYIIQGIHWYIYGRLK